jgi:hypothetical protein
MHWVYVVSGEACTPCARLHGTLDAGSSRAGSSSRLGREQQHAPTASAASPDLARLGLREARAGDTFSLLVRGENVGMDLGGHNTTLEWLRHRRRLGSYAYFIFLNSSVKGPFMPAWVPSHWHWTYAFLAAFQPSGAAAAGGGSGASSGRSSSSSGRGADALPGYSQQQQQQQAAAQAGAGGAGGGPPRPVHAVGASLVCLPADDAGGPGPRLESWAFALDQPGLAAAVARGVFRVRGCKLCGDADAGVVVGGEYGITTAMFAAGYNIATLLSRYARGLDWSDPRHWACNDNAHASRAGLYGGISQHPYETVFVKSSWCACARARSCCVHAHACSRSGRAPSPHSAPRVDAWQPAVRCRLEKRPARTRTRTNPTPTQARRGALHTPLQRVAARTPAGQGGDRGHLQPGAVPLWHQRGSGAPAGPGGRVQGAHSPVAAARLQ